MTDPNIYFPRLVMSSPPHPLMHFGMAGWFKIRGEETAYYKPTKPVADEWPPNYWKFFFETVEEPEKPVCVDNGPDPVIDKDVVTEEWLAEKCAAKKIPIKALLLDQANISGIGNWVGYVLQQLKRSNPCD